MTTHQSDCPAATEEAELCTCGALFRWALNAQSWREFSARPREAPAFNDHEDEPVLDLNRQVSNRALTPRARRAALLGGSTWKV